MVEPHSIPVRSDAVKWQVIDDEAILVHADSGLYFSLNPVGLLIWQHATGAATCQDLVERIVQEFEVDEPTAWSDLQSFLSQMQEEDLVFLDANRISPAS